MRVLLDTHIFIWWDSQPHRLPRSAKAACEDPLNALVLSVASLWEMQIKHQLGKLNLRLPINDLVEDQQQRNGIEILPATLAHVAALDKLPLHHKDPFDRLLIAQANAEGTALLSIDDVFKKYSVNLLI